MSENIFTKKEVEALLRVSEATVRNLITNKKIEHFKVSGKVRISQSQLDAYLESTKVKIA